MKFLQKIVVVSVCFVLSFCKAKETKNEAALLLLNSFYSQNSSQNSSEYFFNAENLFNKVTEAPGATGTGFKDSTKAINGIQGCGTGCGSLDVYSLQSSSSSTYCIANEKCMVLEIEGKKIKNVSGTDFIVFENPFCVSGDCSSRFMEPVIVEVSLNGTNWCGWNPQFTGNSSSQSDLKDPTKWQRFAGINPVLLNQTNWTYSQEDIFDPNKSGGDHFDLDDSHFGSSGFGCDSSTKISIQTDGFIYLRLTSAVSRGFTYPSNSFDQTADIDGAIAHRVE